MLSNLSIVIKQQSRKLKSAAHFKKNFVKTFARIVDKMIIGFLEKNECSATFTEHFLCTQNFSISLVYMFTLICEGSFPFR